MTVFEPKIVILLATRNGAEFLQQQLDSFRLQTYRNWELLVSDDGSTDATHEILMRFAASVAQRVTVIHGPQKGFWQNFVSLVRSEHADAPLAAYSDQDDVWFADRLAKAVAWFAPQDDAMPALYFSRTELIARNGTPLGFSPLFTRRPTFQNALVQNIGGGNTMVFNAAAWRALRATPPEMAIVSHDWWTYQIVTGVGGCAYYDAWPSLQYRQHDNNLVGGNVGARARTTRMLGLAGGRFAAWNEINLAYLTAMRSALTAENAATLDCYARARKATGLSRLRLLLRSGVYRQTLIENIGLMAGTLLKRI